MEVYLKMPNTKVHNKSKWGGPVCDHVCPSQIDRLTMLVCVQYVMVT